ncbi:MAG: hypothetical protein HWE14_12005 [Flavobacteriia bacterium]|nr:hypothetical protein [Flavobacteriia bacterium]
MAGKIIYTKGAWEDKNTEGNWSEGGKNWSGGFRLAAEKDCFAKDNSIAIELYNSQLPAVSKARKGGQAIL